MKKGKDEKFNSNFEYRNTEDFVQAKYITHTVYILTSVRKFEAKKKAQRKGKEWKKMKGKMKKNRLMLHLISVEEK